MGDTFKADLKLGGDLAPSAQSPSAMRLLLPSHQKILTLADHIVAIFVETANISGSPVSITTDSGVIKRQTVTTTRTEQGAGKTMTKCMGAIVVVEQNDPGSAHSGYVTVGMNCLLGSNDVAHRITEGYKVLFSAADAGAETVALTIGFGAATNKKATIYLLGKA